MTNTYQDPVAQAWTTYNATQGKYRGGDYAKLLDPLYGALNQQLGGVDAVIKGLAKSSPPSDSALNDAEKLFSQLQDTLDSLGTAFGAFPAMDKKAINQAATLDQAALTKIYAGVQAEDENLFTTFATTLFSAQEAAARTLGVYAPDPELATATPDSSSSSDKK